MQAESVAGRGRASFLSDDFRLGTPPLHRSPYFWGGSISATHMYTLFDTSGTHEHEWPGGTMRGAGGREPCLALKPAIISVPKGLFSP